MPFIETKYTKNNFDFCPISGKQDCTRGKNCGNPRSFLAYLQPCPTAVNSLYDSFSSTDLRLAEVKATSPDSVSAFGFHSASGHKVEVIRITAGNPEHLLNTRETATLEKSNQD